MRLSEQINRFLHKKMCSYVRRSYLRQIATIAHNHPNYFAFTDEEVLAKHCQLWSRLLPGIDDRWCRMFAHLSGMSDWRYVPEDVFYCVIERCLNNCNASGTSIENKNDVDFYIPHPYRARSIVRFARGVWFDDRLNPIPEERAVALLDEYCADVVGKPAADSSGGANVCVFEQMGKEKRNSIGQRLTIPWIKQNFESYVVQERLRQESSVEAFNPTSINTCRIVTFRRPWSGSVSAIAGMLRIGGVGRAVDNVTSGGVCVAVQQNGQLVSHGFDHAFSLHDRPDGSNVCFSDFTVPYYQEMCEVACDVARRIPSYNLLGFDMIARENGMPCVIEINATSIAMAKLQMAGPLFGDETEKVVEWCAENRRYDRFKHFRTWY